MAAMIDIIHIRDEGCLFRPVGAHEFVEGQGCVERIERVRDLAPAYPLQRSPPLVKNLCGRFLTYLDDYRPHRPVLQRSRTSHFGKHSVMYHMHGTVSLPCGVVYFRGCCSFSGLRALSGDLFLPSEVCEVHMGVFKTFLGRHVQTRHGCYLERRVAERFGSLRVRNRLLEASQAVKLRVDKFDEEEIPLLSGALVPTSLDLTVTNRGVLLLRFSWSRCPWSGEAEAAVLRFCSWISEQLRECC